MTNYFSEDFSTYDSSDWLTSTWASTGSSWLYTSWRADQVDHNARNGTITLTLTDENDRGKDYTGAEVQTRDFFHYGIFEVTMQASGEDGVNSNFFTYSGEVHGNVKNEIDFEFLGKDPTKVWTSYHSPVANGFGKNGPVGERGEWVDLGFDSSKGMHTYRIEWLPDSIRWYADGKLLRVVEAPEGMTGKDIGIPEHPGKMYMNIWAGVPEWMGRTDSDFKSTSAIYDNITYMSWDHPDARSLGDGAGTGTSQSVSAGPALPPEPEEVPEADQGPALEPSASESPTTSSSSSSDTTGTNGNDDLRGTGGRDNMSGGAGNDRINGRGADDVLDGGAGSDDVFGGAGNDTLVYYAAENVGTRDVYVGSLGRDTLTLHLTEDMAERADVMADLSAFQTFLAQNADASATGGNTFYFQSLGLTVRAIEALDVVISGNDDAGAALVENLVRTSVEENFQYGGLSEAQEKTEEVAAAASAAEGPSQAAAAAPQVETVDESDKPTFGSEGRDGADDFRGRGSSESFSGGEGNDLIRSRAGDDVVAGGAGNDFVKAGAGNDNLVYFASDNEGAFDRYQGSSGFDTLSIYMSQEDYAGSNIDDEIIAFEAFAEENYNLKRNGGESFKFQSFNLEVQSVEAIELIIYDSY